MTPSENAIRALLEMADAAGSVTISMRKVRGSIYVEVTTPRGSSEASASSAVSKANIEMSRVPILDHELCRLIEALAKSWW